MWAAGATPAAGDFAADDQVIEAMRLAGASEEVIVLAGRAREQSKDLRFEVWPENWDALRIFTSLDTSWSRLSLGRGVVVRTGIAAAEIESTLRLFGAKKASRWQILQDIRLMEQAALDVFAAQG